MKKTLVTVPITVLRIVIRNAVLAGVTKDEVSVSLYDCVDAWEDKLKDISISNKTCCCPPISRGKLLQIFFIQITFSDFFIS